MLLQPDTQKDGVKYKVVKGINPCTNDSVVILEDITCTLNEPSLTEMNSRWWQFTTFIRPIRHCHEVYVFKECTCMCMTFEEF